MAVRSVGTGLKRTWGVWVLVASLGAVAFLPPERPATHVAELSRRLELRLGPGQMLAYRVRFSSRGAASLELPEQLRTVGGSARLNRVDKTASVRLEGRLLVTVLEAQPEATVLLIRVQAPTLEVEVDGARAHHGEDSARGALRRGFGVQLGPDGRVNGLRFPADADPLAHSLARSLVSELELRSADGSAERWASAEVGPRGPCLATYERGKADDAGQIVIRRHRVPRGGETADVDGETSDTELVLDSVHGRIVRATGSAKGRAGLPGQPDASWYETSFEGRLAEVSSLDAPKLETLLREQRFALEGPLVAVDQVFVDPELALTAARERLRDFELERTLRALRAEAAVPAAKRSLEHFGALRAYLLVHPGESEALALRAERLEAERRAAATLVGALASAGHEPAQTALLGLVERSEPLRLTALTALAHIETPVSAVDQRLLRLMSSDDAALRDAAELVAGCVCRKLTNLAPRRAGDIADGLASRLDGARQDAARAGNLLAALGNCGAPRSSDALLRATHDPRPEVRAQAAFSLRFLADGRADARLVELLGDSDARVRERALSAFDHRSIEQAVFDALERVARSEEVAATRGAALRLLWRERRRFPRAAGVLRESARLDPNEEVRGEAARLLDEVDEATSR